jgi:hypothetical protein
MSANRATNQQLGFHRWLASLRREAPSAPRVGNTPLSAPPPAASAAPPAQHDVSNAPTPGADHDQDHDATRVHHIPKEIIYSLRARAASESPKAPQDERTQVFRAPPELLARAKRAQDKSEAPGEVLVAPSPGLLAEHDFGETLEARSGVRLQEHSRSIQPPDMLGEAEELEEVEEQVTFLAPVQSHFAQPAPLNETEVERLSSASIERLSDAPSFRQTLGRKLWVAAVIAAAAVVLLLAWSTR